MKNSKKPRTYPVINYNECKACERCIISCPQEVLEMSMELNERGYHYVVYKGSECSGCGNCYYTCPEPLAIEVHIPKKVKIREDK